MYHLFFFFFMIRRPPRSTLFPTRRSSDLELLEELRAGTIAEPVPVMVDGSTFAIHGATRTFWVKLWQDRKSTRLNSSHGYISYAVFCLKKKKPSKDRSPTSCTAALHIQSQ